MQFAKPYILYWLWLVVPLYFIFSFLIKRRKRLIFLFVQQSLIKKIVIGFSSRRLVVKYFFLLNVVVFGIIAMGRPQWGFEWQEVKRQGLDILVVIDTSKSMLTQDVKPNRLERTKLAVKDLIKKLQGDRIGLIAFSGDAFLVCPLTVDYNGFVLSLNELDVNAIPRGGTNISRAINEAIESYEKIPSKYKAVIIMTDGDNLEGDPLKLAKKAKEKGIKIYTIGIGTKEGELIQIKTSNGSNEFLKDNNGNFVKSRLNEELLQKISLVTGGAYVKASGGEFGFDLIYDRDLSQLEKREIESKMGKRYHERFQYPLFLALLFLTFESCLSLRKEKNDVFKKDF